MKVKRKSFITIGWVAFFLYEFMHICMLCGLLSGGFFYLPSSKNGFTIYYSFAYLNLSDAFLIFSWVYGKQQVFQKKKKKTFRKRPSSWHFLQSGLFKCPQKSSAEHKCRKKCFLKNLNWKIIKTF